MTPLRLFLCDEAACQKDSRFYEAFEMDERWEIIRAVLAAPNPTQPWEESCDKMTQHQYRTALERLGLTQDGAAQLLGVSIRTSHGYANGSPVPESVAKLLRLMIRLGLKPEEV